MHRQEKSCLSFHSNALGPHDNVYPHFKATSLLFKGAGNVSPHLKGSICRALSSPKFDVNVFPYLKAVSFNDVYHSKALTYHR